MQKLIAIVSILLAGCCAHAQELKTIVYFDNNQYDLRADERQKLVEDISQVTCNSLRITLCGHADLLGSVAGNDSLSKRRAHVVHRLIDSLLANRGCRGPDITSSFFGSRQPVAANADEQHRKLNRRVEVNFYFEATQPVSASVTQSSPQPDIIGQFYDAIRNEYGYQKLHFAPNKLVRTQNNTIMYFPYVAGATLQEAQSVADILLLNLSSTSDLKPIATEGMYLLNFMGTPINLPLPDKLTGNGNRDYSAAGVNKNNPDGWAGKKLVIMKPLADSSCLIFNGVKGSGGHLTTTNWQSPAAPLFVSVSGKDIITTIKSIAVSTTVKTKRGKLTDRRGVGFKWGHIFARLGYGRKFKRVNNGINYADHQKRIDSLKQVFQNFKIDNVDSNIRSDVNYIIFEYVVPQQYMSINCDYFPRFKTALVNYEADIIPQNNLDVKLVFDKYKVVYPGRPTGNKFVFDNVPKGETARLVAIKYENNKPCMAVKEVTLGTSGINNRDLVFNTYQNLTDFRLALTALNQP